LSEIPLHLLDNKCSSGVVNQVVTPHYLASAFSSEDGSSMFLQNVDNTAHFQIVQKPKNRVSSNVFIS